jgi:SAM-dependent methyltransferase
MLLADAAALIAPGRLRELGPTTWADLGCGSGTFTLALADALAPASIIHVMDRDALALKGIPARRGDVRIERHRGNFTRTPWPFHGLGGILLANSLHYVAEKAAFVRLCEAAMTTPRRFLIVEYGDATPNRWVPFPIGYRALVDLFHEAGYASIQLLGSRPSAYRRGGIYAALVTGPRSSSS